MHIYIYMYIYIYIYMFFPEPSAGGRRARGRWAGCGQATTYHPLHPFCANLRLTQKKYWTQLGDGRGSSPTIPYTLFAQIFV